MAWRGQPLRYRDSSIDRDPGRPQHHGQRLTDPVGLQGDISTEEGLADDPQGQGAHLPGEVHLRGAAGSPPVNQSLSRVGHCLREDLDLPTMKCWLRNTSLPEPGLPFVGQETVGQKATKHLEPGRLLVVVLAVVQQDVTDVIGVREKDDIAVQHAEVHGFAMGVSRFDEQANRVSAHPWEAPEPAARSGICGKMGWHVTASD